MAAEAAAALMPYTDRPYSMFGHCFGGRFAYALTVALVEHGASPPDQLFLSSCLAPHEGGRFGPYLPEMADSDFAAVLSANRRRRGEEAVPDELLAMAVPVLRADVELSCAYVPVGPELGALALTTIGWREDPHVQCGRMSGWSAYGRVRHVVLDGDESTFRNAPDKLRDVLASKHPDRPQMETAL
jgi:surfactin synthase thioesterase subunit